MTIRKLTDHRYSNCHIELDNNAITFVSYGWYPVIAVDADGWMSVLNPHYSATTCKQVGWFLREYFPEMSYQFIKWLYNNNLIINVLTGEVQEKGE